MVPEGECEVEEVVVDNAAAGGKEIVNKEEKGIIVESF